MKHGTIAAALLLLTRATAMAEDITSVQNGTNSATITQSGPSGETQKSVERTPGHTRIEQRSGANSAVITQDSSVGAVGSIPDGLLGDTIPVPPPRPSTAPQTDADADDLLDDAPASRPKAGIDVYGTLREHASPQGQANLDRLMNLVGPGAKTK